MKNLGLDLAREAREQDGTEHVFGSGSPKCIFHISVDERGKYLPIGELQKGIDDFQDCVSRRVNNIWETKLNFALRNNLIKPENHEWLERVGYVVLKDGVPYVELSDRWLAILSDTTRSGNSMKAPTHASHKYGVIPKSMLPSNSGMTWEQYHNKGDLTDEMYEIGKEFISRFELMYDKVPTENLEEALKTDMVGIGVYAWPRPKKGEYPRVSYDFTHDVMAYGLPRTYVFDNYLDDDKKDDWIKKLAPDYRVYEHGYRQYIRREMLPGQKKSIFMAIVKLFSLGQVIYAWKVIRAYLGLNEEKVDNTEVPDGDPEEVNITKREKLLEVAMNSLGKDLRTGVAPKNLACVEHLVQVIKKVVYIPEMYHTSDLGKYIKHSSLWKGTLELKPGNLILSITGTGNGSIRGHAGIILDDGKIASNDSITGKWDDYHTIDSWRRRYSTKGGMKILVFELK